MKKFLITVVAILCFCALTGCSDETKPTGASGNVVLNVQSAVFTADGDFFALTDTTTVKDYMDALAANGELVFGGSNSEYGFYIESIYGTKADGNAYWAVYTDLVTIDGDDAIYSNAEWGTYLYGNKVLNSASFGVSALPCVDGYTYAFVYTTY